uniref:DNA polymerase alpha catalytic subunit n=1 Tax=Caenorhabditis japonica TaxID=281687 RepID=A0A8R1HXF4_CAEJA
MKSAIERLKEARASGKAYRPDLDVADVYETVDDAEYEKIVSQRQQDNFVVDDDGMGYVDTGVDFEDEYEDEYEEKSAKSSKKPKKEKKEKKKGGIHSFLASMPSTKKSAVDESKVKATLDDDEDLKDILEHLNDDNEEEEQEERTQRSQRNSNPFKRARSAESPETLTPRPIVKKPKTMVKKSAPVVKPVVDDDDDDDDDYGVPEFEDLPEVPAPAPVKAVPAPIKKEVKMEVEPADDDDDFENPLHKEVKQVESSLAKFQVQEEAWTEQDAEDVKVEVKTGSEPFYVTRNGEKAIRMYWIDAYEDVHKANGTVYLFGKVKTSSNSWESCSVVVKNIQRKVYFMPRARNLKSGEEITGAELHNEIRETLKNRFNTQEFKCKMVEKELIRDESFGQNGGTKTPMMEVLYPADKGKLPTDLNGNTFSHVFNTSVTPLERLLIEKKFFGPGWIELFNYADPRAKISFCKYEFEVDMERMRNVKYLESEELESIKNECQQPPIRLLALQVITTLNEKKENEICMISTLFNAKSDLAHPSSDKKCYKPRCCEFWGLATR